MIRDSLDDNSAYAMVCITPAAAALGSSIVPRLAGSAARYGRASTERAYCSVLATAGALLRYLAPAIFSTTPIIRLMARLGP